VPCTPLHVVYLYFYFFSIYNVGIVDRRHQLIKKPLERAVIVAARCLVVAVYCPWVAAIRHTWGCRGSRSCSVRVVY
jgi:hypothetical protein